VRIEGEGEGEGMICAEGRERSVSNPRSGGGWQGNGESCALEELVRGGAVYRGWGEEGSSRGSERLGRGGVVEGRRRRGEAGSRR